MAYIGNQADTAFTSLIKQDLTGASGTSLTLTHAVANANDIALYINNVRQEPVSAYSTNGTEVSLTGSVVSSDDIYVIYLARAVQTTVPPDGSVSTAKIASSAVDLTSKVTGVLPVANGGAPDVNSVIETWNYDTTSTSHNNGDVLEEDWNRKTDILTANKNGGMSVSSGIFSFPSTGVWRIELDLHFLSSTSSAFLGGYAQITTDNSNYTNQNGRYQSVSAGSRYGSVVITHVLNITDITNQKIRWVAGGAASFTINGGNATSDINATVARFIKLCPSV